MSQSQLPNFDEILKTFEPEAIQSGLAKLPGLVEDAFQQLESVLPKFLSALPKADVTKGRAPLSASRQ